MVEDNKQKKHKFQEKFNLLNIILEISFLVPQNDKKSASRLHIGTPDMKSTNTFSPVSYSPLTTTKRSRIESGKTGNVVCTFGNFSSTASNIVKNSETIATISVANLFGTQWMDDKVKFMTTSMNDGQYVTERIFKLGHEFLRKIVVDEKLNDQIVLSHCDELSQDNVKCLGKIVCGGRSEKLDQKSCTFIGFDENKLRITQLDMTRMKMPAQIFPGQVCVLNGTNPRGKNFSISEIHAERTLENCTYPSRLTEPLSFVIGSGPFTSDDNLTFEYLDKLIENCQNNKPDVLILSGAFFDAKSKLIFDLATEVDEHFRKMLTNMSEKLGDSTKIVIVASHDDINSSACFPTRSYGFSGKKGFSNNIFLAPDPCILNVNGIKIAVTSVDVTKHLADSEFCMNAGGDKIRRYINYLFHQKSFYPLFPPKVPTDTRLLHEYATINEIPHIFIAPSDMKYYMRDFNNCLCLNPGRIKNENSDGTFARVIVKPPPRENNVKGISSWISGQIVYL